MTQAGVAPDKLRAVRLFIASSPEPVSQAQIADGLDLFLSVVSVAIAYLRAEGQIRIGGLGTCRSGRRPKLYDTRVELPDVPDEGRKGRIPPLGVSPSIDGARRLLAALEPGGMLSARQAAEQLRLTPNCVQRALRVMMGAGQARVAGWIPRTGTTTGGRATPLYDAQLHLPNVPEPKAVTRAVRRAGERERVKKSPVRLEEQRQKNAERKRDKRRAEREAAAAARPAFDPKTAINWRRAA
jgi:predicted ArsR family transcriptional regulator